MISRSTVAAVTSQTGGWYTLKQSTQIRVKAQTQQRFRQFARILPEFGPHMGPVYQFPKLYNLSSAGQEISEFGDIPVAGWSTGYGQCTTKLYSNSIQLSQEADIFSELSVVDASLLALLNEANSTLDKVAAYKFRTCELVYTPTGTMSSKSYVLSNNGTAAAAATRNMTMWDLRRISHLMRTTYKMPYWSDNMFVGIIPPSVQLSIREDNEYHDLMKHYKPEMQLRGELAPVEDFRLVGENNVLDDNLNSGTCGECVFFGRDPMVGIELEPFELQAANLDPYGRFRAIRWLWRGGYERTWDYAADTEARILRVGSL